MLKPFEKNIHKVWLRCSINMLLKFAAQVLIIAGVIAITAVVTEKLLAINVINNNTLWSFWIISVAVILIIWLYKQPGKMQISLLIDERMKLKERFSTTFKISNLHNPFYDAARNEALGKAQSLNLHGHFPIKPSKCWIYTVSIWFAAVMLTLYMPQKDLLGIISKKQQQEKRIQQNEETRTEIKKATAQIKREIEKIQDPEMAEALNKLDQLPPNAKPQEVKRQAIRQLGDLSEQIKNMQKGNELASMKIMQQMLKQLRGSQDSFSQQLRAELAQGNFGQASSLLRKMQKELAEGNLSEEQQKKLAEQMQALAKALEALAEKAGELENELEKLGLDKDLAKMGEKQLREALQKQGLSQDQIEDLVKKAAASNMARSRLSQLANSMGGGGMGGPGGLSGDELADAIDQLDGLESMQMQMMLTEATLDQIAQAIGSLGQGMGQGLGQSPFQEGYSMDFGAGSGGPGMGMGPRGTDEEGEYGTKKDILNKQSQQGPIIASWYIKDMQVKGEAELDFSEVIEAGREAAAEAISENEIPRKYEEAVISYFSNIEESYPGSETENEDE